MKGLVLAIVLALVALSNSTSPASAQLWCTEVDAWPSFSEVAPSAVAAPFRVFAGGEDEPIASGTVGGGAVILDPGTYRVEVQSDPPFSFEDVIVRGNESVSLELPIESD